MVFSLLLTDALQRLCRPCRHPHSTRLLLLRAADVDDPFHPIRRLPPRAPRCQQTGATPLYIASKNGHLHVVERLIEVRADVNTQKPVRNTATCFAPPLTPYTFPWILNSFPWLIRVLHAQFTRKIDQNDPMLNIGLASGSSFNEINLMG